MDCFDVLYPDLQLMVEVDHSAGHAKFREDGLHVGNMNVKYGGKQKIMRDTTMTEGCVGPGEAKMHLNSGKWSTQFVQGVTEKTVDLKLRVGATQSMVFKAGDPPPFYACDAQSNANTSKTSRGKVVLVHEAYAGKPKGCDKSCGSAVSTRKECRRRRMPLQKRRWMTSSATCRTSRMRSPRCSTRWRGAATFSCCHQSFIQRLPA